jgi:hypothetical protein
MQSAVNNSIHTIAGQATASLLDENAAADFLNCSVAFLRRCRLLRRGPVYVKLGRLVRYSFHHLQRYIESSTQGVLV